MLPEPEVRRAFETLRLAANRMKIGCPEWVHAVAAAGALGYVLDEGTYRKETEVILAEIRRMSGEVVSTS